VPDEPVFRYRPVLYHGDTLHAFVPTLDGRIVYRFTYAADVLARIDIYDYSGQDADNLLDFVPVHYQIPVGREYVEFMPRFRAYMAAN
jgi:hypothetical protein